MTPRVSVVLIFLDEERFLAEAIESVLSQSSAEWELLLVDDGSRDGGTAIARRYADADPGRIVYLQHPDGANRGMSAARNLGMAHARGAYISFLDGDDVLVPTKLAEQSAILDAHPEAGFVIGRAELWHTWHGNHDARDRIQRLGLPTEQIVAGTAVLARFLVDEYASPCDVMVRRQLAEVVGGYEESFRGMYEDQAFHAKLCLQGAGVWVSDRLWYRYRQHANASTVVSKATGEYRAERRRFLAWVQDRARSPGFDPEIAGALEVARWPFEHPVRARIEDARRRLRLFSSRPRE